MITIENNNIIKRKIVLNSIEKVKNFVPKAMKLECDIDLVAGKYLVDAKSIMGIFSLDLTKTIDMIIHSQHTEDVDKFLESINSFICD